MYGKPVHGGLLRLLMRDDDNVREWLVDLCRIALKHSDAAFLKALAETMILVKSPPPAGEKVKLAVWQAFPLAASKALKDKRGFLPDWTDILDVIQERKLLPKKDTADSDKMRREIQRSIPKLGYDKHPFSGISDEDAKKLPPPDDFDL